MQIIEDNVIDFSEYMQAPADAAKIRPASNWADGVVRRYHDHGNQQNSGCLLPWANTHSTLALRSGEMSLWSGTNGHGKSQLLGQVMLWVMMQTEKVCIASMEMKPVATMARMVRQAATVQCPSEEFIRNFHAWTDGKLWLYDQQGTVKQERILAVVRYCSKELGISHFVIDSLMKCGIGTDDYNRQKAFVDELSAIARDTGMHIHLVAHSRKGADEYSPPGKMDVKGASEITDQVDNVFSVWRNKKKEAEFQKMRPDADIMDQPDALLICDKQRHGEWEGRVSLWYDQASFQYVSSHHGQPQAMRYDAIKSNP